MTHPRPRRLRSSTGLRAVAVAAASLLLASLVAACASGAGSSMPPPSPATSAAPAPVDSPEEAGRRVIAAEPRFAGIEPQDPEMIGACCWYEAREVEGGYEVAVEIGWGDCPSGCTSRHRWLYAVSREGALALIDEVGESVPPGVPGAN